MSRKRYFLALALLACGFVGWEGNGSSFVYALGDPSHVVSSGNAQDFALKNLNGEEVQFSSVLAENKLVLLNFWATWCPPCIEETPDLVGLQRQYAGRSFTVVGVNVGESEARAAGFAKRYLVNYPVLLDRQSRVAERYGVVGIPTSFLLKPDGQVLGVYHAVTRKLKQDIEANLQ